MRNNSPASPFVCENTHPGENAWPEWLRPQSGLTPVHVPPPPHFNNPDRGFRSVALLGRFQGQPYITLKVFRKKGRTWRPTQQQGATFPLAEFRVLLVKLNDVLTRRPELGEDRQIGGLT